MQPAINKIRSHIHQQRPLHRIRNNKPNIVRPQKTHKLRYHKALVPNLNTMPQRSIKLHTYSILIIQPSRMSSRKRSRSPRRSRQQPKERFKPLPLKPHLRRKLPQYRPKLFPQPQHPARKIIRQRHLHLTQLQHMRDVTRSLQRKHKIIRGLPSPHRKTLRLLQRIKRPINLHRVERPRRKLQLSSLRQTLGIEHATPPRIPPARDANPHPPRSSIHTSLDALPPSLTHPGETSVIFIASESAWVL